MRIVALITNHRRHNARLAQKTVPNQRHKAPVVLMEIRGDLPAMRNGRAQQRNRTHTTTSNKSATLGGGASSFQRSSSP